VAGPLLVVDTPSMLFRAFYAPRPAVRGRDGIHLSGVSGLCDQLLYMLREEGATHVGCATDRVIESFRNDLFPGYKSSAGMDPELLAQFPIAETAIEALGLALWPEVEFEADDAIRAAAARFGADDAVERADPRIRRRDESQRGGERECRTEPGTVPEELTPGRRHRGGLVRADDGTRTDFCMASGSWVSARSWPNRFSHAVWHAPGCVQRRR